MINAATMSHQLLKKYLTAGKRMSFCHLNYIVGNFRANSGALMICEKCVFSEGTCNINRATLSLSIKWLHSSTALEARGVRYKNNGVCTIKLNENAPFKKENISEDVHEFTRSSYTCSNDPNSVSITEKTVNYQGLKYKNIIGNDCDELFDNEDKTTRNMTPAAMSLFENAAKELTENKQLDQGESHIVDTWDRSFKLTSGNQGVGDIREVYNSDEENKLREMKKMRRNELLAIKEEIERYDQRRDVFMGQGTFEANERLDISIERNGEFDHVPIKVPIPKLKNVLPIFSENVVLQKLVDLGVDLSAVQKQGMAEDVLNMNFDQDVKPILVFLTDRGVKPDQLGDVVSSCPAILKQAVHNLKVRYNYFRSKNFSRDVIAEMVVKDPNFLAMPVELIDAKLGFLQKYLNLTGAEIRGMRGTLAPLIPIQRLRIEVAFQNLKYVIGFTPEEIKKMVLAWPKIIHTNTTRIVKNYDYVHDVMDIPHAHIVKFPQILTSTVHNVHWRHRFLLYVRAAQYDPNLPNYVSLALLVEGDDETWCTEVAKSSLETYEKFLRMV